MTREQVFHLVASCAHDVSPNFWFWLSKLVGFCPSAIDVFQCVQGVARLTPMLSVGETIERIVEQIDDCSPIHPHAPCGTVKNLSPDCQTTWNQANCSRRYERAYLPKLLVK